MRRTKADPGTTNQHQNRHDNYTNNVRPHNRPLQRQGTNAKEANREVTQTSVQQRNRCSSHDMTINRPQAGRSTPNWHGMHGSRRERRPTGWRHGGAPRLQTTISTNTTEHRTCTITKPDQPTLTNYTALHLENQDATSQQVNRRAGYTNNIRLCNHRQRPDGTHANQADHEAAKTTTHKPHCSCSRKLTVNRPHASRPTSNQQGVHGSKQEQRPAGWPHHSAPRPPMTIPKNKTEHRDSTVTQPTNQH